MVVVVLYFWKLVTSEQKWLIVILRIVTWRGKVHRRAL